MRALVLGANGMLGHRLLQSLGPECDLWATVRGSTNSLPAKLSSAARVLQGISPQTPDSVVGAFASAKPQVVINCIGIVKQRDEAHDPIAGITVNSLFPHELAHLCDDASARLIHVSTDCVFSGGKGSSYAESDLPDPSDLYGRTKLLGELERPNCITIRTSMVGWELGPGAGLLEWLARNRGNAIQGYRRAVFSGLSTSALSDVIARLALTGPWLEGLRHISAEPIDKYNLTSKLVEALGWPARIEPVDEPVIDRSLDSSQFRREFGWSPPSWDEMISALAAEYPRYERWRSP